MLLLPLLVTRQEKFEDIKGVIRNRKSKDIQYYIFIYRAKLLILASSNMRSNNPIYLSEHVHRVFINYS